MKNNDFQDLIETEEPLYKKIDGGFCRMPWYIRVSSEISSGAKDLYEILLHYFQQNDSCFPGQERLAIDMDCAVRSIREYICELTRAKLIRVKRQGLNKTNIYTLLSIDEFLERSRIEYEKRIERHKSAKKHPKNIGTSGSAKSAGQDVQKIAGQDVHHSADIIEEELIEKDIISNSSNIEYKSFKKESDIQVERKGEMESVGNLLSKRLAEIKSLQATNTAVNVERTRAEGDTAETKESRKASKRFIAFTVDVSRFFGDEEHIAQNIAQMKNIYAEVEKRGIDEAGFIDFAYGVKGLVKGNIKSIRGSKMGYYCKSLRMNFKIQ